jgi:hypothetical protein
MERMPGLPKWLTDPLPPLAIMERHVANLCAQAREWPGFVENEDAILLYIQTHPVAPTMLIQVWEAYKAVVLM